MGARSSHRPTANLPAEVTSFVGRRHEIAQIKKLLRRRRLVTVTGVPGVGKTRLALRVAAELRETFADGVWLVELGPLVDPSLVPQRVAVALEVREKAKEPLTTALANALRLRNVLLVLDNCEHLLDACALLVDDLLKACPGLSVLATSREPIGILGEMAGGCRHLSCQRRIPTRYWSSSSPVRRCSCSCSAPSLRSRGSR